jgi:glycosyltransferase involved in cell wall biosynthesis
MRILIVGYACNPYGGSEPGVGWAAVCRIARNHDVWVLTDISNKSGWERGAVEGKIPANVKVRFLRDRSACSPNRFIAHIQSWLNYASFNRQVLQAAMAWHQEVGFDLCHQVTIAAWRMPSPLWRLPIPFVWGPIGGAGEIPRPFRSMLSPSARLFEVARDIQSLLAKRSPNFLHCIRNTAVIFAANGETMEFLKPFRPDRPLIQLPIASLSEEKVLKFKRPPVKHASKQPLRLFAGGNMEGRKGVELALMALAKVDRAGIDFRYTIAGGGPEIPALKKTCTRLGLDHKVVFHQGFSGDEYLRELHESDVYFLPSFRESTPVTLLEACIAGCYAVVADTSAQGEIVRSCGGSAVPVSDMETLIQGLANAVIWCANNMSEARKVATEAAEKVAVLFGSEQYDNTVAMAYSKALSQN